MTTHDATSDLDQAITAFRTTEATLHKLVRQSESVATAREVLSATQQSLQAILAKTSTSIDHNDELAGQLERLAGQLADATEVVRQIDPARIFDELTRLTADFERQKERISEMTGETRARIEESTRSTASAIETSAGDTVSVVRERGDAIAAAIVESDEAGAARARATEGRLRIPAIIAAVMSTVAVMLLIADLVTR